MRPNELMTVIESLSLSKKLMLVEDIWDSIARDNNALPMPAWQKAELDKRYGDYRSGKLKLHDWKGVHTELRNASK